MRRLVYALLLTFAITCLGDATREQKIGAVIFITIDTLRADHLGMFGYPRDTSPFLDLLAARSINFTRAIASSSHTGPSHASMFTGLQPVQHGVLRNGQKLRDWYLTLAEMFQRKGYETAAFTSTNFLRSLNQGFHHFDAVRPEQTNDRKFRPANVTVDQAIAWLSEPDRSKKTFVWIHVYDVHDSLPEFKSEHHKKYLQQVTSELSGRRWIRFLIKQRGYSRNIAQKRKLQGIIDRYDAQIRNVDTELKRLYETLRAKNGFHDSLWIITSDHGEGLGNHNYLGHGEQIYQEQLHVPLLFYYPDQRLGPRTIPALVRHVDLLPTVAELMEWKLPAQILPLEGASLAKVMRGQTNFVEKEYAFSQRRPADDGWRSDWIKGEVYSLQNSQHKYIIRTEGEDEFYDLTTDPFERNNLTEKSAEKEYLRSRLEQLYKTLADQARTISRTPAPVEEEYIDELKSLGYIN